MTTIEESFRLTRDMWAMALSMMSDEDAARFISENIDLCIDNNIIDEDTVNRILNERTLDQQQLEEQLKILRSTNEQAKKEREEKVKSYQEEFDQMRKYKEEHTWEEYIKKMQEWTKESIKNKCLDKVDTYIRLYFDESNQMVEELKAKKMTDSFMNQMKGLRD